eukprot:8202667-Pyramimonas_sp.AAC.2
MGSPSSPLKTSRSNDIILPVRVPQQLVPGVVRQDVDTGWIPQPDTTSPRDRLEDQYSGTNDRSLLRIVDHQSSCWGCRFAVDVVEKMKFHTLLDAGTGNGALTSRSCSHYSISPHRNRRAYASHVVTVLLWATPGAPYARARQERLGN